MKSRYFMISNDVETTSLWNHTLNELTGEKVMKEGMPILLKLYEKYNIKSTFFFTGHIAKLYPDIVRMIQPYGHEVGCHGLNHNTNEAFDVLSFSEQVLHLKISKDILENIAGEEIMSFRAPALRVNQDTPAALAKTGFKIDSSIAPQRMDFMFSFGSKHKLNWLFSPRHPYFTSITNLAKKGNSEIMEFPLNAFALPYVGTLMRISPILSDLTRFFLNVENKIRNTPISFLIHPNELIEEEIINLKIQRRAKNYFSYLLADRLRYKLKLKNLGTHAIPIFEDQLQFFQQRGYISIPLKEYYLNNMKSLKSTYSNIQNETICKTGENHRNRILHTKKNIHK